MIGRGGMGEVHRARDTRLGRDVAIKMLPTESAWNPVFRARLEREARAVAALNHPHICSIYDVGRDGTIDYVVFEYVAGETLAAILQRGALALNHILKYAVQLADALAAAHEAGVIHRDLKPGNIMVDRAGGAKLLDFGLAKFSEGHSLGRESTATALPDIVQTTEGAIVGTLNYMSPEQAEGKPLDARTDIFSFGAVLYEMITSRKAFDGNSSLSILSSIVHDEPVPIREITTHTPKGLERIVEHCMQKDQRRRFQHMLDLKFSLDALKHDLDSSTSAVPSTASSPIRQQRSALRSRATAIAFVAYLSRRLFWLPGLSTREPLTRP
jgi:eukaryotic-like serine/threonine-protein kinase